ncbi:MAG: bifunctional riboflavin kinase/FAD synthetase [Bdellovibrionia bacterium]
METFRGIQTVSRSFSNPVITIGNFDGVHLGHQQIIRLAVEKARASGGTAIAYTFRPHPQQALRPGTQIQLLTTYDEKLELLAQTGIDVTIEEPFSREFSTVSPKDFFTEMLLKRLGARAIVVGYDFAFGKERQGSLQALEELCKGAGVELTVVSPQRIEGEIASSSKIRQYLLAGEVDSASRLLGREFFYRGIVVKGEGRGRKLGFPTANLKIENKLTLPYGVYATWARCEALFPGQLLPSVTNVGVRPTFEGKELPALVETHLFDRTVDLYGNVFEVRFVKRLREERKFPGIDALKAQISADSESAKTILKG